MTKITFSSSCKCLAVSTSGYCAWRKRQLYVNQKYTDLKAIYWEYHTRIGPPSLTHDMHNLGYCMSERTVRKMLKKLGLRSKIAQKNKHVTDSNHRLHTPLYLLDRQFTVMQPNKVWITDITYIRTKESWSYLCVMLYLFSRRIDRQLVCDNTFNYTLARQGYPTNNMVHADQGCQYCSCDYRALLLTNNCIQSMSRRRTARIMQ